MLLISIPNSAITVPQLHIPPPPKKNNKKKNKKKQQQQQQQQQNTHFQKAVDGIKKLSCGHSNRMKVTLNETLF